MPSAAEITAIAEPYLKASILTPTDYTGTVMDLCQTRRGEMVKMEYLSPERAELHYRLPLAEVVIDFFDQLKSRTQGYASLDYEQDGYTEDVGPCRHSPARRSRRRLQHDRSQGQGLRLRQEDGRQTQGAHPAPELRGADPGGDRRQDHRPHERQGVLKGRHRQALRRRHHAKEQAAEQAEGRQEADEIHRAVDIPKKPSSLRFSSTISTR